MTSWRHLECTKKPSKLTEPSQIDGVGMLKPEDEARVYEWWTSPAAYAQKRKAEDIAAAVGAAQAADDEPPSTPKKAKTTAAPSDTPDSNKALPPARPTPPTTSSAIHDEAAKRAEYEAAFGALPVPELKNCLRENQQLLSGAKGELVERCVDRKLFGNLPQRTSQLVQMSSGDRKQEAAAAPKRLSKQEVAKQSIANRVMRATHAAAHVSPTRHAAPDASVPAAGATAVAVGDGAPYSV